MTLLLLFSYPPPPLLATGYFAEPEKKDDILWIWEANQDSEEMTVPDTGI